MHRRSLTFLSFMRQSQLCAIFVTNFSLLVCTPLFFHTQHQRCVKCVISSDHSYVIWTALYQNTKSPWRGLSRIIAWPGKNWTTSGHFLQEKADRAGFCQQKVTQPNFDKWKTVPCPHFARQNRFSPEFTKVCRRLFWFTFCSPPPIQS